MKFHPLLPSIAFSGKCPSSAVAAPRAAVGSCDADNAIRRALLKRLEAERWWDASVSNVFVDHGVVVYQGLIGTAQTRGAAREVAMSQPGVHDVWDARVPRREWQVMA